MKRNRVSIRVLGGGSGGGVAPGADGEVYVTRGSAAEWSFQIGGEPLEDETKLRGVYDPSTSYAVGDIVAHSEDDGYGGVFTSFYEASASGLLPAPQPFGSTDWTSLPNVASTSALHIGTFSTAGDVAGTAVGIEAVAALWGTAFGCQAFAGDGGIAYGWEATALDDGWAVGLNAVASGYGAMAAGSDAKASEDAVAFGRNAQATNASVAIGSGTQSSSGGAVALGVYSQALAPDALALGVGAMSYHNSAAAIGGRRLSLGGLSPTESTGDFRATFGYRELEVGHPAETTETALILRSSDGAQWRITVDTSGNLQVNPL